jgi:importin subunit beta-1
MDIRIKAFECIATVADLYYTHLPSYMEALFQITATAIKTDDESVGNQAIEFWSAIGDIESEIVDRLEENDNSNSIVYLRILEQVSKQLVPILLETLTKQDDENDDDEVWNISKSGATCLEIIAYTLRDNILELIFPFITSNVNNPNWHFREASIMAFGTIINGPSENVIKPIILSGFQTLINCAKDSNKLVRSSAVWTIGRICDYQASVLTNEMLIPLFTCFLECLDDPAPHVVLQACYCIDSLSSNCCGDSSDDEEQETNILSTFLARIADKLLEVFIRPNVDSNDLTSTAYLAMSQVINHAAIDMHETVFHVLNEALTRLELTFQSNFTVANNDDVNAKMILQGTSDLIDCCVRKLPLELYKPICDRIMDLTLQIFSTPFNKFTYFNSLSTIGCIVSKLNDDFIHYDYDKCIILLLNLLQNMNENYILILTIIADVISDCCRSLKKNILPYCDDIIKYCLKVMHLQEYDTTDKAHLMGVFTDIALTIHGSFEPYLIFVMQMLHTIENNITIINDNDDNNDVINTYCEKILEVYTGIVQV